MNNDGLGFESGLWRTFSIEVCTYTSVLDKPGFLDDYNNIKIHIIIYYTYQHRVIIMYWIYTKRKKNVLRLTHLIMIMQIPK